MKTYEELLAAAAAIRDAQTELMNTATVVGTMFADIVEATQAMTRAATAAQNGYMTAQQAQDLNTQGVVLSGLTKELASLQETVKDKVSAIAGYGLIENSERERLKNVRNYTHPTHHAATVITEDATHRFMTDTERTKLAGIAEGATKFSGKYSDLQGTPTIPTTTAELRNNSGFLTEHQDISGKVDKDGAKQLSDENFTKAEKTKLETLKNYDDSELKATVENNSKSIGNLAAEASVSFSEFVDGVTVAAGSTSEAGKMVYDKKVNKFLYKVLYNGNPSPTYFAQASKEPLVGTNPKPGIVYKCGTEIYVGVSAGLSQQFRTVIETV